MDRRTSSTNTISHIRFPRKGFIAVLCLDRISKQAQSRQPLFLSSTLSSPYQDIGVFANDHATMDCSATSAKPPPECPPNLHIFILGVTMPSSMDDIVPDAVRIQTLPHVSQSHET